MPQIGSPWPQRALRPAPLQHVTTDQPGIASAKIGKSSPVSSLMGQNARSIGPLSRADLASIVDRAH
jgi:hypothetical protein